MTNTSALKGITTFSYFMMNSTIKGYAIVILAAAILALTTGNPAILSILPFFLIAMPSYTLVANMSVQFEKLLLTTIIRRKDFVTFLYLQALVLSILGVGLYSLIRLLGANLGNDFIPLSLSSFLDTAYFSVSLALLFNAILIPVTRTPFGRKNRTALGIILIMAPSPVIFMLTVIGEAMGLGYDAARLVGIGISFVVFIVSYYITKALSVKWDI